MVIRSARRWTESGGERVEILLHWPTRHGKRLNKGTLRSWKQMTVFSRAELDYLATQPLGRLATAQPDGTLQVSPVGFRYNSTLDTIDITGHGMEGSRKFRNVADNGRVAFVVDDMASVEPFRPRCIEIRGYAETTIDPEAGPKIRIQARRIISFGIDEPVTSVHSLTINARDVNSGDAKQDS
jgi:pyridoxamine 5'-phosphate oxidase family protein